MANDDSLDRYRQPVSAEAPAGEDLTYDEAYLRVREEVDRMGTVSVHVDHESGAGGGGGGVDFGEIATEARSLLTERTRDLQLAAYMTIALSRSQGAQGLAEGLETTLALAQTFGETVHPVKPLRRRNALQFLSDRLKDWLADHAFEESDVDDLVRALTVVEALQAWTTETMGENAPALSGLRQAIEEAQKKAARKVKAAETAAPSTPAAPGAPADGEFTLASAADARKVTLRVCSFLREQDPASGVPYRLARALVWGSLASEPPSDGGKTQLEAPDVTTRGQLQALVAGGNSQAVLAAAEQAFPSRPFWLDLQRLASQAAAQLGHAGISRAIDAATTELLDRLPGLSVLAFTDGSAFADDPTQGWLQGLNAGRSGDAPAAPGEDALAEALENARALAGKGDLDAAVRALHEAPAGSADGRARLRRDLHVARLCVQGGRAGVAAGLLAGLVEEADRRSLDEWEPALALELWRTAHSAWSAAASTAADGAKDEALRRSRAAFERVCRLDPAAAIGMAGPHKKGPRG
jgi:type VI secretion system protein VasJ